ncbi:MAG TPA: PASTA domain-containing protein [Methylomirabilota bacterium]|nr:PASTA domain-containing protein [Methylomirabilota bacterium]
MPGIFISYRRDDSAGHAGRLFDRLTQHFGKGRVFMDVSDIEPGTDFVEAIDKAVGSCEILIVVIGREWLTCVDAGGQRRLDDPNDFIRLEAATALKRNIRVIPVLVQGARMPKSEELPADLEKLARRQGIEISDTRWDSDAGQLIKALEAALAQEGQARPASRPEDHFPSDPPKGNRKAVATLVAIVGVIVLAIGVWLLWPRKVEVPRLTGQPLDEAQALLADRGFVLGNVSEEPNETVNASTVLKQQPNPGTRVDKGTPIDLVVAVVPRVTVPDVVRQEFVDAEAVLAKAGLQVGKKSTRSSTEVSPGSILSQNPPAGERVPRNTRVDLVLATRSLVSVPDVVKISFQEARSLLEKSGLAIGEVQKREIIEPMREQTVLEQTPRAREKVDKGTRVNLVVSVRPSVVTVPDILGKSIEEARVVLGRGGLGVGTVQQVKNTRTAGVVLRQIPSAGEKVGWGTKINLTVATQADTTEPAPAISIRSKGLLTIPEGRAADLDEGTVGSRVEADIGFPRGGPAGRYVESLNGALMAIVPRVTPDGKSCAAAKLATAKFSVADLPANTLVCVRTNQGRYAYFRVLEAVGPSPGTLKIGYVTWN